MAQAFATDAAEQVRTSVLHDTRNDGLLTLLKAFDKLDHLL